MIRVMAIMSLLIPVSIDGGETTKHEPLRVCIQNGPDIKPVCVGPKDGGEVFIPFDAHTNEEPQTSFYDEFLNTYNDICQTRQFDVACALKTVEEAVHGL